MRTATRPAACLLSLLVLACGSEPPQDGQNEAAPAAGNRTESVLPPGAQAMSLLGEPLFPPEASEEARARQTEQLEEALTGLEANPDSPDALIWVGRRQAYLGQYRAALETFTDGMELHPQDARFFRHRGHRYITVREFDAAIADYQRAADLVQGKADEVEPDGQPNALGIPTSTLQFNIWYHYGLAHFLKGEFDEAVEKYNRCWEVSEHPDSKVATAHWLYMSLRRAGREEEARGFIQGMDLDALAPDVIESGSYLTLLRLYLAEGTGQGSSDFAGLEGATQGYGLGNWALYNGDVEAAREIFQAIVAEKNQWGAFGYIAAEADLARLGEG